MILPRGKLVHFLIPAMPRITSFLLLSSAILFLSLLTKKYISPTVGWQGWGCTLSLLRRFLNPSQAEPCWAEPRKTHRGDMSVIFPPDALLVIFNTSTLVKAKLLTCTRTTRKYKNMCGNETNKMLKQATNTNRRLLVVLQWTSRILKGNTGLWDCPVCETHFRWALCFRHVVQYNITACESKGVPHLHFLLPASIFPSPSFCLRDQASLFLICGKNFNSSFM